MKSRKQKTLMEVNQLLEQRYIYDKFLKEEETENGLPEFQITPTGIGKYKIKFTWENKGVKVPEDVSKSELFKGEEFDELKKEFVDMVDANKVVDDFKTKKSYIFKKTK
jgi:hypothetical protein